MFVFLKGGQNEKKYNIYICCVILVAFVCCSNICGYERPELDSKEFETLWRGVHGYYNTMYDTASLQLSPQVTVFLTDSNGVPYIDGKAYVYGIFEKQYTASEIMEQTKLRFSKVMTDDLVNSIVEDFHVTGGPDIEQVRVDADGNLYKLYLITFGSLKTIKNITVNGNKAHVTCDINLLYTFAERSKWACEADKVLENTRIDLVYTDDGWRISGGEVFDYVRNFANIYPGAEYETAPSTGDESDTAVITLAMGAVVSALIPMTVFIRRRKRKLEV